MNDLRTAEKAKATRARALSVLREVYRALVVGEVCAINPAREVKIPRVDTEPQTPWLNEDGLRQFLLASREETSWTGQRDRALVLCLAFLGARREEIARLQVADFVDDAVKLTVKRGKRTAVGVPPYLATQLAAWRAFAGINEGALFPRSSTDRRPVSGKIIYDAVKGVARLAKLDDVTPHALRRTFITILNDRGVDIKDLQFAVAHQSVTTTERYRKASKAAKAALGEKLRDLDIADNSIEGQAINRFRKLFTRIKTHDWDEEMVDFVTCSSGHWGGPRGYRDDTQLFVDMLREGAITVCVENVRREPRPLQDDAPYSEAFNGGASDGHGEMKWWAFSWLRRRGEERPIYEYPLGYGKCDVWAPSLQIAVECGDTTAIRVADGLALGYREMVVFMFSTVVVQETGAPAIIFRSDDRKLLDFANRGAFSEHLKEQIQNRVNATVLVEKSARQYDRGSRGMSVAEAVAQARARKAAKEKP